MRIQGWMTEQWLDRWFDGQSERSHYDAVMLRANKLCDGL